MMDIRQTDALYERVAEEIAVGDVRSGLWAKALSECEYDNLRARAMYIKLRASMLKEELAEEERVTIARQRENQRLDKAQRQSIQAPVISPKRNFSTYSRVHDRFFLPPAVLVGLLVLIVFVNNEHFTFSPVNMLLAVIFAVLSGAIAGLLTLAIRSFIMFFLPRR